MFVSLEGAVSLVVSTPQVCLCMYVCMYVYTHHSFLCHCLVRFLLLHNCARSEIQLPDKQNLDEGNGKYGRKM